MIQIFRLDQHPLWRDEILPLLYTNGEFPRRGRGGCGRVEVREPRSSVDRDRLLRVQVQCCHCGAWIFPIRERQAGPAAIWGASIYLSLTCAQSQRPACSRSGDAGDEAQRIIELVHGYIDPRQPSLFEDP